jgi:hypothetical protein
MRRPPTIMLIMLVASILLPLVSLPATAAAPSGPAEYSRAAMSRNELAMLPGALGKVTKAGKVAGTIDAAMGDIVLPSNPTVPDGYAGRAPTMHGRYRTAGSTAAATAAATVLHAERLRDVPAPGIAPDGTGPRIRTLIAMEENTSNQARGYFRARLVYGDAASITWRTYYELPEFRVHRGDEDNSEADGCLSITTFDQCTWTKDPGDCRGPAPACDVYLVVGTYRPKGNSPDLWLTEVWGFQYWHPLLNAWFDYYNCVSTGWLNGYWWKVGTNQAINPAYCGYPT